MADRLPFSAEMARAMLLKAVDFLPSLVAALLILLVFVGLQRLTTRMLRGGLRRARADPALQGIAVRLARTVVLALGLLMAANQLGFAVGSLLAGLGIMGLAVGFAAQDTIANLIAGFTILWDRPFRIGDQVTVAGTFGRVVEIGLRSTRLRTPDDRDAILPNKQVIEQLIVNHTSTPQLRLTVPLVIGYGDDIGAARRALLAVAAENPLVAPEPAPQVVVTALGESGVALELRAFVRDAHVAAEALGELFERAKTALDGAGIEIPFPTHTVRLVGLTPPETRGSIDAPTPP